MPKPIFSHYKEHGISMYGVWSVKHAYTQIFLAHCVFQIICWNKVKNLDRSLVNVLNVFFVLYVTQTLSKGITNVGNWHTSTVQLYGEVPLSFLAITCRTLSLWMWKKHRNVPLHQLYLVTKFDGRRAYPYWSTSLKAPFSIHVIQWYYTIRLIWACLPMLLQAH